MATTSGLFAGTSIFAARLAGYGAMFLTAAAIAFAGLVLLRLPARLRADRAPATAIPPPPPQSSVENVSS